jgi:hypothetical protein
MEHKEVIEYYNNGQDDEKLKVEDIFIGIQNDWKVKVLYESPSIGFYEWLFNPRYKVFEVFNIDESDIADLYFEYGEPAKTNELMQFLKESIKERSHE